MPPCGLCFGAGMRYEGQGVTLVASSVDAGAGAGPSVPVVVGEPLGEEPSALMGTPVGEAAAA